MPWARFTADFDWRPSGATWTVAYLAGMRCNVTRDCLAAARAGGAAAGISAPPQDHRLALKADPLWREP
jgi:hypothetical protein